MRGALALAALLAAPRPARAAEGVRPLAELAAPGASETLRRPPRLAVLLIVDQLRADYPERFGAFLGEGGFRRLEREGTGFPRARYPQWTTLTCVGHSLLGSGLLPRESGIVANTWYDAEAERPVYCADEAGRGPSAALARGRSLAGRLKERWPRGKAVALALKDRSAVHVAGEGADAAYWLEGSRFVTSPAFPQRPELAAFEAEARELVERAGPWTWSLPVPMGEVCPLARPEAHTDYQGLGRSFPHPVSGPGAVRGSPAGNALLAAFARRAVEALELGADEDPDVLSVSFSAFDYIGHHYGPDSCEVADAFARLDRELAALLSFLEERVGRDRLLVVLTSDHGVAPLPEVSTGLGRKAGRLGLYVPEGGTVGAFPADLRTLERDAAERFGYALGDEAPASESLVAFVGEPWLYLRRSTLRRLGLDGAEVRRWLKGRLGRFPGVEKAWTREELAAGRAPEAMLASFHPERSGDLLFALEPYWILDEGAGGTTHGTGRDYDARIPLHFWGGGVPARRVRRSVSAARVAPTVAERLGLSTDGMSDPRPLPGLGGEGR